MAESEQRKWRIATRLKEARSKTSPRLSQAEIARRIVRSGLKYFSERHASRLELGYMDATHAEVAALARVLSVNADWLCGMDRPASPIQAAPAPSGMARAAELGNGNGEREKPAVVALAPAPAAAAPTPSRWPPCPGVAALDRGSLSDSEFRARLNDLKDQTNRMLHTSGLPAAEWRQWRELEKHINERYRTVA